MSGRAVLILPRAGNTHIFGCGAYPATLAETRDSLFRFVHSIREPMKVAVARETSPGETRVALIPDTVKQLVAKGHAVRVEAGAGQGAFFSDEDYTKAGAAIEASRPALWSGCDVLVKINKPAQKGEPGGDEVA